MSTAYALLTLGCLGLLASLCGLLADRSGRIRETFNPELDDDGPAAGYRLPPPSGANRRQMA